MKDVKVQPEPKVLPNAMELGVESIEIPLKRLDEFIITNRHRLSPGKDAKACYNGLAEIIKQAYDLQETIATLYTQEKIAKAKK